MEISKELFTLRKKYELNPTQFLVFCFFQQKDVDLTMPNKKNAMEIGLSETVFRTTLYKLRDLGLIGVSFNNRGARILEQVKEFDFSEIKRSVQKPVKIEKKEKSSKTVKKIDKNKKKDAISEKREKIVKGFEFAYKKFAGLYDAQLQLKPKFELLRSETSLSAIDKALKKWSFEDIKKVMNYKFHILEENKKVFWFTHRWYIPSVLFRPNNFEKTLHDIKAEITDGWVVATEMFSKKNKKELKNIDKTKDISKPMKDFIDYDDIYVNENTDFSKYEIAQPFKDDDEVENEQYNGAIQTF